MVLLTHESPSDAFLAEHIEDLRSQTDNQLIYAEQVDLASLHSIRLFATKWVDNAPPRRLDGIILCAATMTPKFTPKSLTEDGVEINWGVNYLANFHLLSILSPALRAQPPDRDVRVLVATCASYIGAQPDWKTINSKQSSFSGDAAHGTSKLALMTFAQSFQKHLDVYQRPDKQPNNARVVVVDPGWARTPGMRRWLSMGTLSGLLLYLIMWPFWWLILKSPAQGAQSFLHAAMEEGFGQGPGGKLVKECKERDYIKKEIKDEKIAEKLWNFSEQQIEALEKEGAIRRARQKKKEAKDKDSASRIVDVTDKTNGTSATENQSRAEGSRRSRKKG
jgi:NAD(P)-dependent dehydrogenase (short-subunit alcohol dehydrogenase family)